MIDNNNNNFKMKAMEWRGYTVRALEELDENDKRIEKKVDKISDEIKVYCKKVEDVDRRINNLYFKVVSVGSIAGALVSVVGFLITSGVS